MCAAGLLLVACAGDDGGGDAADTGGTLTVATLPPVATTSAVATAPSASVAPSTAAPASATTAPSATSPVTAAPAATTTPPTTVPVTTTTPPTAPATTAPATAPCVLDVVVEQTQTRYEGVTPSDLRCIDGWAAWIGRPDDQFADGFFAVARANGTTWELVNLGTAGVCADAGVPAAIWADLGCFE